MIAGSGQATKQTALERISALEERLSTLDATCGSLINALTERTQQLETELGVCPPPCSDSPMPTLLAYSQNERIERG